MFLLLWHPKATLQKQEHGVGRDERRRKREKEGEARKRWGEKKEEVESRKEEEGRKRKEARRSLGFLVLARKRDAFLFWK